MFASKETYRACIYTRLSRDDGDKPESDSIANQRALIRDYLKQHKEITIVSEHSDDGYSGVNFERPGFAEMMDEIREGKVDCVVVKDLSRFGRNYIEAGNYIEKVFPFMGVRFIAINDSYDSSDKSQSDSLVIPFKNLINDAYCKDISVKIRSQLEIKRKKGEYIGAFVVYGYVKDPEDHNRIIVDTYAAEVVRAIFRWKMAGMSQNRIADKLNSQGVLCPMEYKLSMGVKVQTNFRVHKQAKWSAVSVTRILTNELYTGVLLQGKSSTPNYKVKKRFDKEQSEWIRIENAHEAIITAGEFETVQELLGKDTRISPDEEALYPLAGYVVCGDCGQNMVRKTIPRRGKKYVYYVCSTNKAKKGCSSHSISENKLMDAVLHVIKEQISTVMRIEGLLEMAQSLPENQRNIFNYDAQIVKLQEEIERNKGFRMKLYESLEEGMIDKDEYFIFKKNYSDKISLAEKNIQSLEAERDAAVEKNAADYSWVDAFKKYEGIERVERQVVVNLISEIRVYEGNVVEIDFQHNDAIEAALKIIDTLPEDMKTEA
ncbi:MAG: recombinase family protein [Butyrivibrio sp.]|nr:recombinase family protein [Butyrivibrio sp.]